MDYVESHDKKNHDQQSTPDISRPSITEVEQRNLKKQQDAIQLVTTMTNNAEAALYKDDDSISTLGSFTTATKPSTITGTIIGNDLTPQSNNRRRSIQATDSNDSLLDNQSTTSSITMESFTNLQRDVSGMQQRFDRMEVLLYSISQGIQGGRADEPTLLQTEITPEGLQVPPVQHRNSNSRV